MSLLACGNPVDGALPGSPEAPAARAEPSAQVVTPPFDASGELQGFLLVWFDDTGVHTAQRRSDVPEARREHVRVTPLDSATAAKASEQLAGDFVYVADLREAGSSGAYTLRKMARRDFDALIDRAAPAQAAETGAAGVVVYKAAWCGVCKSAASFLRERHVAFVEKDVEKDAAAHSEMLRKTQAKGMSPTGVPVIDFHGEILLGFDRARLSSLIERAPKPI